MIPFVQSELYKVLHKRGTKIFFLFFGCAAFFFNYLFKLAKDTWNFENMSDGVLLIWMMIIVEVGWFLVLMISQMVHSNEGKVGVLKNSVSVGMSRTKIYISRWIAECIVMLIAILFFASLLFAGHFVFLGKATASTYQSCLSTLVCLTILWIGALSMCHFLNMVLNSNSLSIAIYILYFMFIGSVMQLLMMFLPKNEIVEFIQEHEIAVVASAVVNEGTSSSEMFSKTIGVVAGVGFVYFIVFFILGIIAFRKKEIK